MALAHVPPPLAFNAAMVGPVIATFGNEEQKQRFLPATANLDIWWCQGFSEPNAGSDLASLTTRAVRDGDEYVINGQKTWTTLAQWADWIFCLVRTDPNAPKHDGISFILFDMESPGVTTKPITLISGASPFCQTFFDDVLVPKANLVGKLNKGWDIAKYLLTHERDMIGGMGTSASDNRSLGQIASETIGTENGVLADTILRGQIATLEIDGLAFRLTMERVGDMAKLGQAHPAVSSLLKYYGTELNKRRMELVMAAGGSDALEWEGERSREGRNARAWLRSKANSIEGGTSEVQLNIVAKRILGLPGA
jgi:acyl-CoA dehydrogenase